MPGVQCHRISSSSRVGTGKNLSFSVQSRYYSKLVRHLLHLWDECFLFKISVFFYEKKTFLKFTYQLFPVGKIAEKAVCGSVLPVKQITPALHFWHTLRSPKAPYVPGLHSSQVSLMEKWLVPSISRYPERYNKKERNYREIHDTVHIFFNRIHSCFVCFGSSSVIYKYKWVHAHK